MMIKQWIERNLVLFQLIELVLSVGMLVAGLLGLAVIGHYMFGGAA